MQGVPWTVLGERLIGSGKYREIKRLQDTSNEERLRAVVECWLGGGAASGYEPSWRRLICTLDHVNQTSVADTIRRFTEPVIGKSCDSTTVSTFCISPHVSSGGESLLDSLLPPLKDTQEL